MAADVVALKPRPEPEPARQWDLRLNDDDCSIEMTVHDAATGKVVAVLEYTLTSKTEDFDLNLLRAAWSRWRGSSPEIAS